MPLSLSKLEDFLSKQGFIPNKFFIMDNTCFYIELFAVKTSDIFLLYIPSKYSFRKDPDNNTILKRPDGWCNFLGKKGGIAYCKIYKDRPSPCRDFPGEICGLKDNVIFSDMSNKPKKVQELWKKAPKKTDIPKEEPKFPLKKLP